MRNRVVLAVLIPLVLSFSQGGAVHAVHAITCSEPCWIQERAPTFGSFGALQSIAISYTNAANGGSIGIVFGVFHNYAGQTVGSSTATVMLPAGGNGTAQIVEFGLPAGAYSTTLLVVSPSGLALSAATEMSITVAGRRTGFTIRNEELSPIQTNAVTSCLSSGTVTWPWPG